MSEQDMDEAKKPSTIEAQSSDAVGRMPHPLMMH